MVRDMAVTIRDAVFIVCDAVFIWFINEIGA